MSHLSRIVSETEAAEQVRKWQSEGLKVAFTNGCFDLIHRGHLSLLQQAAALADKLVIGLNSDKSVRRLKGSERPVKDETDRSELLAALVYTDLVLIFEADTPAELIKSLQPDVLVKGGDYKADEVVGAETVRASGGEVVIVPLIEGQSSTRLIKGMKK